MKSIPSAADVIDLLRAKQQTLAIAESLTGGALGAAITSVPGSSDVFLGGVIAYSPLAKESILRVKREKIEKYGVVSQEVAIAMAQGVQHLFGSTWGISTTGVAGPGESGGVRAGTVWIAIAGPVNESTQLEVEGEREVVQNASLSRAIFAFARILGL